MTRGTILPRTMRFVLFNAEEHGLVGSKVYARQQRATGVAIAAVFQMDMIGYNKVLPRTWEVHAGFAPSPTTEERSLSLAELLRRVTSVVAPELELPESIAARFQKETRPTGGAIIRPSRRGVIRLVSPPKTCLSGLVPVLSRQRGTRTITRRQTPSLMRHSLPTSHAWWPPPRGLPPAGAVVYRSLNLSICST